MKATLPAIVPKLVHQAVLAVDGVALAQTPMAEAATATEAELLENAIAAEDMAT